MNSNNPPFEIGQRVIRIGPSNDHVIKGERYTVAYLYRCPKCNEWKIGLEELPCYGAYLKMSCSCGFTIINPDQKFYNGRASYFAPIQDQYNDIREQLASEMKEVVESPDIKKIVEPQTN